MNKTLYDCWQALDPKIGRISLDVERIVLERSPIVSRWWRRLTFTPLPYLWRLEEKGWARSEPVEGSSYQKQYFKLNG